MNRRNSRLPLAPSEDRGRFFKEGRPSAFLVGATLLLLATLGVSCKGHSPTSPDDVRAIPNATAFDNLQLVEGLEHERRPDSLLVNVGASAVGLDGHLVSGACWAYVFASPDLRKRYQWEVFSDGSVNFADGNGVISVVSGLDITPLLKIDSDEAVQRALDFGVKDFVDRHPESTIQVRYRHFAGIIECHLHFSDLTFARGFCELDVYLNGTTGEFLSKGTSCDDNP